MTAYDDDADRLSEECEYCGKLMINCICGDVCEHCHRNEDNCICGLGPDE